MCLDGQLTYPAEWFLLFLFTADYSTIKDFFEISQLAEIMVLSSALLVAGAINSIEPSNAKNRIMLTNKENENSLFMRYDTPEANYLL